ncbi:DNA-binding protein [Desulfurococcaceae archaeon AG1]|nr:MAG: DNA-binding protein [Desulfurococcaceae archaeon]GAY25008.1 DNA-binding protein [Desulfurococcaceae archaeon AG1]HWQ17790.1 transcription elongation factor subunit Spt4 [Sulfolobales archaeon]
MSKQRKKGVFKACKKCKALAPLEATVCSICGSSEFSEEWSGMVIIIDPEGSQIAKSLGITKPGRYAIKIGS